ncbi:MAG: LCP family protein [Patescibacteria group bacterium]
MGKEWCQTKAKRYLLLGGGALLLAAGVIAFLFLTRPARPRAKPAAARLVRTTNILIIGTDKPTIGKKGTVEKRTDVLLLASCDPGRGRVALLSIPRDTLVDIPGHGMDRINAANVYGGLELTRLMVEKLTGLTVHKHLAVDFNAFVELVDLLGGVEIEVDKRMHYRDSSQGLLIDLRKGRQVLNGRQALGFVRYRLDPMGDISRIQRQQRLIQAIVAKAARERLWNKIIALYRLKRRYIRTDLNLIDLYRLKSFSSCLNDPAGLAGFTVPGWFAGPAWRADAKSLAALIAREFRPVPPNAATRKEMPGAS